jgi:plasmid stabilization system protein ParE
MPLVTRTQQAEDDIADLFTYLGRRSRAAALRGRGAIDRAARMLSRSPLPGRARPELRPDHRSYPVAGR